MSTRKTLILAAMATVTVVTLSANAYAQICRGSSIRYFVRDEQGVVIDAASKDLTVGPPTQSGGWRTDLDSSSSAQAPAALRSLAGKTAVLEAFGMCQFKDPVTLQLTLHGKTMNLTFLTRGAGSTDFFVDSLPFQQGTFEIDLTPNLARSDPFFPATGWKKVQD